MRSISFQKDFEEFVYLKKGFPSGPGVLFDGTVSNPSSSKMAPKLKFPLSNSSNVMFTVPARRRIEVNFGEITPLSNLDPNIK